MTVKRAAPKIRRKKITDYQPDSHNANLGTERGLQMLEDSLQRVGVGRSIVADKDGRISAGNKTLEAAMNAGIEDVIEIETDGHSLIVHKRTDWDLSDPTGAAREYAHADNRISQESYNPDYDMIVADLQAGLDLSFLYNAIEIAELLGEDASRYTRTIDIPLYEPSDTKPRPRDLYDDRKTQQLIQDINAAPDLTPSERTFLKLAAMRHTVFYFKKIADFYAHSDPDMQRLMEDSALVIIDFQRALELGYVKLTKRIAKIVKDENNE